MLKAFFIILFLIYGLEHIKAETTQGPSIVSKDEDSALKAAEIFKGHDAILKLKDHFLKLKSTLYQGKVCQFKKEGQLQLIETGHVNLEKGVIRKYFILQNYQCQHELVSGSLSAVLTIKKIIDNNLIEYTLMGVEGIDLNPDDLSVLK